MMFFSIYVLVGLIVNVYTMKDRELWEFWVEFGFFGFVLQLLVSTLLFPLIIRAYLKKEPDED